MMLSGAVFFCDCGVLFGRRTSAGMTQSTRFLAGVACATICGLCLFPPRVTTNPSSFEPPRGFLLGNIAHGIVPVNRDPNGSVTVASMSCRIDIARLLAESMAVLSGAAALALFFQLRSGAEPNRVPQTAGAEEQPGGL